MIVALLKIGRLQEARETDLQQQDAQLGKLTSTPATRQLTAHLQEKEERLREKDVRMREMEESQRQREEILLTQLGEKEERERRWLREIQRQREEQLLTQLRHDAEQTNADISRLLSNADISIFQQHVEVSVANVQYNY